MTLPYCHRATLLPTATIPTQSSNIVPFPWHDLITLNVTNWTPLKGHSHESMLMLKGHRNKICEIVPAHVLLYICNLASGY